PYWLGLIKRFSPKSPRVPQALYHAGLLLTSANKPDEALGEFTILVQRYPDSLWTPDAQVRLIDVKLEQQFDLPGAAGLAAQAVAWCERQSPLAPGGKGAEAAHQSPLAPGGRGVGGEGALNEQPPDDADRAAAPPPAADSDDSLPAPRDEQYNIYLRAGLIEYLQEHKEAALSFFEKAKPFEPKRDFEVVQGHIPTGIEQLVNLAKNGKVITPASVKNGDGKAKLILMLADIYHEGQQHGKSLELCTRLICGAAAKATREQLSYAYFRRARNYYLIAGAAFNPDAAMADYVAAVAASPKAAWADSAMFLAGNIEWNDKHDAPAAIAVWRRLLKEYPKSKEADRSAFFIGLALSFSRHYPEAQKALNEYMTKYPESEFIDSAREALDECNGKIDAAANRARK
ncbi:MAG TPA: tetratricopeptide repeat protein, partial [Tepidisphaeraceae bacterium]|nr:tetratricopeptide repeat protein [Tepidisphaeraceae bacterium]